VLENASGNLAARALVACYHQGYLADCLMQTGRLEEAAALLEENYQTLLATLGANHKHTLKAQSRLEIFSRLFNNEKVH
jgi:hypothetical protein